MINKEMYLKRFLVRLESEVPKKGLNIADIELENHIVGEECSMLENRFESLSRLYEEVKIHYAEEHDEAWVDGYKTRVNTLQKYIVEIKEKREMLELEKKKALEVSEQNDSDTEEIESDLELEKINQVESESSEKKEKVQVSLESVQNEKEADSEDCIPPSDNKLSAVDEREELFRGLGKSQESHANKTEKNLELQKRTQEELADELLGMSKILKNNTSLFSDILQKDQQYADDSAEIFTKNSVKLKKEGDRLNKFRASSWSTTGLTWMAIAVVVLVFAVLVMVIKVVPKRKF
ncbi:hypothetical protein BB561_003950 [Smittium simulii]|uniref:Uncharacterized protein n=1 Tax=Smittium simulii TaxID=133385 RepID=A0A2T9YIV5_9FUNG|nr:hypothetical protein BB561_003950 [Smittium simulii]